jgi:ATP-dependent helicase/nuclease subunit A
MSVVDQSQREAALKPDVSFLVRAPAGSGKTELLIQRYLSLLARASRPEAVVAITFTRKAAAEMRRRVMDALAGGRQPQPEQPHKAATWRLARAALERDEAQGWGLTENPRRFAIRTFDSLWTSIVSRAPWLSRLGPPPAPVNDASDLYSEAALRTVELLEDPRFGDALETMLRHVDNNQPKLVELLVDLLGRRDQWLRHVTGSDPAALRAEGERALETIIVSALQRVLRLAPNVFLEDAPALASFAAGNLRDEKPDHDLVACEGMTSAPPADVEALPQWLGLAALVIKKSGGLYSPKGVTKKNGFPAKCPEKARVQELLAALDGDEAFVGALEAVQELPPARYDDTQWAVAEALIRMLPVAAAQLRLVFRERGEVDFTELAQGALEALGGEEAPTDLAFAFDAAIEHLLVDEFQDTSFTQLRLLECLTAGWTLGDGRTLFLVGDPMQSIYRFREAEVRNFLDAEREARLGGVPLQTLVLEANFRSRRNIVEWVNETFETVFAGPADPGRGAVSFAASACAISEEPGPAVAVHPFLYGDEGRHGCDREEARRVVEIVARTRQQHPEDKIAVLVRARTHLPEILRALSEAGVRYRGVELDPLSTTPVIQDLLSLTAALLHPADRLAWLAILRAPWCGLTLTELHGLCGGRGEETVWEAVCDAERIAGLSQAAQQRLARLRDAVQQPRPWTLRAWVEGVWLAIGGPAGLADNAALDNAQAYFDLLDELDKGRDCDLELLRARVDKLFAAPDPTAGDSVQVMTIHKAKGLQFDVVIAPGLGRRPNRSDSRLLRWREVSAADGARDLLLAPSRSAVVSAEPIHAHIQTVEGALERHEACRLLYVATTRAKRELHLLGAARVKATRDGVEPTPESGSLLNLLWDAVECDFDLALRDWSEPDLAASEVEGASAPQMFWRLTADWRLPELPQPAAVNKRETEAVVDRELEISFHWVGRLARYVGTVVHAALAEMARDGLAKWDAERPARERLRLENELRALGVGPDELPRCADQVVEALRRTLEDKRGRWVLESSHSDARGELALAGMAGGRLVERRVDRTFVDADGIRWIVDFKTSVHEGGGLEGFLSNELERYRGQMQDYRELLANIEPERKIRVGLYFPLMGVWREYEAGTVASTTR